MVQDHGANARVQGPIRHILVLKYEVRLQCIRHGDLSVMYLGWDWVTHMGGELFWKPEKNDRRTDSASSLAEPTRARHTRADGRYPLVPGRALSPNSIIVVLFLYTFCFFFHIATKTYCLTISTAMRSVGFGISEVFKTRLWVLGQFFIPFFFFFCRSMIDHVHPSSEKFHLHTHSRVAEHSRDCRPCYRGKGHRAQQGRCRQ